MKPDEFFIAYNVALDRYMLGTLCASKPDAEFMLWGDSIKNQLEKTREGWVVLPVTLSIKKNEEITNA